MNRHGPHEDLWDSFWAEHASSDQWFHRLLWRVRFWFSRAYAARLLAALGPHSAVRLVEVGCGSARTLQYMNDVRPGCQCIALDKSVEALRIVRQISPGFLRVVSDAGALALVGGCFHIAFSIGLIEHFDRPTAAAIVREMSRVTAGEGIVAVMVPWRSSFYNLVRHAFGRRWPFGREQPFRRSEIRQFMLDQDLRDVQVHVIYGSTLLAVGRKPPESS